MAFDEEVEGVASVEPGRQEGGCDSGRSRTGYMNIRSGVVGFRSSFWGTSVIWVRVVQSTVFIEAWTLVRMDNGVLGYGGIRWSTGVLICEH